MRLGLCAGHVSPGGIYFFRFATFAACFPSAVRVRLGSLLMVRLRFAAAAALLTLRRAAARCLGLAMKSSVRMNETRVSGTGSAQRLSKPERGFLVHHALQPWRTKTMIISEVMSSSVYLASPDDTLQVAAQSMAR
jgi:hypothetical protein